MNQVNLIGRLTSQPDLRYIQSTGSANVRFTLAVDKPLSREKRMELEQQNKPTADFIRCVAWGKRAETIAQYVGKGQQFAVTGRIETGSYQNDQGQTVYTTDVLVQEFTFISGSKNRSNQQGGFQQGGYQPNAPINNQKYSFGGNDFSNPQSSNEKKVSQNEINTAQKDDFLSEYGLDQDAYLSDDGDIPF